MKTGTRFNLAKKINSIMRKKKKKIAKTFFFTTWVAKVILGFFKGF